MLSSSPGFIWLGKRASPPSRQRPYRSTVPSGSFGTGRFASALSARAGPFSPPSRRGSSCAPATNDAQDAVTANATTKRLETIFHSKLDDAHVAGDGGDAPEVT